MFSRREALLGVLLAPIVKPIASILPKAEAPYGYGQIVVRMPPSYPVVNLRNDAQRKLNEWWSVKIDDAMMNNLSERFLAERNENFTWMSGGPSPKDL